MIKNQKGFGHFIIIVAILVAILGFAAYRVVGNKDTKTKTTSTTTSNSSTTSNKTWTDGDMAVKGRYADADVVKVSDAKWRMYYAIQPEVSGNNLEIYSSTSSDGKSWKADSGTRKTMATFPDVVKLSNGKYRMYFQNSSVIKSAISNDGLTFTDESGTRIDKSNTSGLTLDNVAAPTVMILDDKTYLMVYRGTIDGKYQSDTPNQDTNLLMWATSKNGLSFTKKGIAVDSRNSTLRGQLDGPDLVKWDDGTIKMFVTNYDGVYEYTFDGSSFDDGKLTFTLQEKTDANNYGIPPGDPAMAYVDNVWYMYYGATGSNSGIHYATLK